MRPRQVASALGYSRPYFFLYWSHSRTPTSRITNSMMDTGSIFVHIPKTAGMTIHRTIYDRKVGHGHAPAFAFQKRSPELFQKLFSFTLMREPTDRFISAFYYLKTSPHNKRDEDWANANLGGIETPNDLLNYVKGNRFAWGRLMSWVHFNPQSWYMTNKSGDVIVDYVGRVERFDDCMTHIAAKLGKSYTPARVNNSKRPREVTLDDDNMQLLHKIYHDDYELYKRYFPE